MGYNARESWNKEILRAEMAWPAEYVIRMFKGKYPNLNLRENGYENKKICDMGCGDGRNLAVLKQCGFDICGVEITDDIVERVRTNLGGIGIDDAVIKTGTNDNVPFEDECFDYFLSWNECYYMGNIENFEQYVNEFARVIKKDGYLVMSIPKKTCFIYEGSEEKKKGYQIIRKDPFNTRIGEVLRMFENEEEIQEAFSSHFKNFVFGSIHDDCFGYNYHWHLVVCQKK